MAERDNIPLWDGRPGRYEAWFLTLTHRDVGYWIRYSLRAPVVGPPEPRLWFARFDRRDPSRTFGVNVGLPPGDLVLGGEGSGTVIRIGGSVLEHGRAGGRIHGAGHEAVWDLGFETGTRTVRLLPDVFYLGALAPTKPFSPNPDARFAGTMTIDGEEVALDAAPGQQGHVYGTRHADRWAWAACNGFEEHGFVVQVLCAQTHRGPVVTPHASFASVRVGGRWLRLGGWSRRRPWDLGTWRVRLRGSGHRLEGEVRASPKDMVRTRYLDPDGAPRWCHASEVASSRFTLWERGGGRWSEVAELLSDGTTNAEWVGRTPAPGDMAEHAEVP